MVFLFLFLLQRRASPDDLRILVGSKGRYGDSNSLGLSCIGLYGPTPELYIVTRSGKVASAAVAPRKFCALCSQIQLIIWLQVFGPTEVSEHFSKAALQYVQCITVN